MRIPASSLCLLAALAPFASLTAQGYSTDFEAFTATALGTPCAGQDGFYIPPVASTFDGAIYTYAGNPMGVPQNVNGGANFYCGIGVSGLVRAQRNVTPPTNSRCVIQFDILVNYTGTGTPVQNVGGVSLQPSAVITPQFPTAAVYANLLARWTNPAVLPLTWNADAVYGPTLAGVPTVLPDPAFQNLAVGVWHTWGTTIDLRTKEHINFRITNGVTAVTTIYTPPAPIPMPNQASTYMPTDFRLFTGAIGNLTAFDNFTVTYGATYDTFGTGCPGALGIPTLALAPGSGPTLGTTLSVNVGNLPFGVGLMITGLSNTLFGGAIPLPMSLAGLGYPGCNLLVDAMLIDTIVGPPTSATWSFPIPNNMAFAGFTF